MHFAILIIVCFLYLGGVDAISVGRSIVTIPPLLADSSIQRISLKSSLDNNDIALENRDDLLRNLILPAARRLPNAVVSAATKGIKSYLSTAMFIIPGM